MNLARMLIVIEAIAICAFALSGMIESARKRMDIVGIFTVAFVAAFGGGTLRDVLLDRRPLFWVLHHEYVWLVLGLALAGPPLLLLLRHRLAERLMQGADALGLGLFAASGAMLALEAEMPLIVAVLLGVVTGVFGGVLRDVLCNEIPLVFRDHSPYALCAFAGGWVLVGLHWLGMEPWISLLVGAAVTTCLRLLALFFDWRVPPWPAHGGD